jgi:atypical dual specificity phosphatase
MVTLQMEIIPYRGTLSLCGPELADHIIKLSPAQVEFPHITIITKYEAQKLGLDLKEEVDISQESLQILSQGQVKDVEFLTVSWAHAQLYRKKLGLGPKDFHITLSKVDKHDVCKDFTTTRGGYPAFLKIFQELPETAMDYILADLHVTSWQRELSLEFLVKYPTSYRALIRFADHK